jgi:hypothetical protein
MNIGSNYRTNKRDQSYELKFELGNQTLQIAWPHLHRLLNSVPYMRTRHYASESPEGRHDASIHRPYYIHPPHTCRDPLRLLRHFHPAIPLSLLGGGGNGDGLHPRAVRR